MTRRGFTLVELLVALVLLGVALLGCLASLAHAARAEREQLEARAARARAMDTHERGVTPLPRGWSLVELLVVLVVASVVVATAGAAAHGAGAQRAGQGVDARAAVRRLEEAADLLASALREGGAPQLEGDSVLSVERVLGIALACGVGIVAHPEGHWRAVPRAGDRWRVWRPATGWEHRRAIGGRPTACPTGGDGWQPEGAPALANGDLVVVTRDVRWTAYRDVGGRGQLGLREANAAGWESLQPVVGPLDSLRLALAPADAGWRLELAAVGGGRRHSTVRIVQPRNP